MKRKKQNPQRQAHFRLVVEKTMTLWGDGWDSLKLEMTTLNKFCANTNESTFRSYFLERQGDSTVN